MAGCYSGETNDRWRRVLSVFGVAVLALLMFAGESSASHFRFGHITWTRVSGNTVEFTSTQAWRSTSVGTLSIDPGDGSALIRGTVTNFPPQTDRAGESYTTTRYTVQHTYANEGPFTASIASCCRIGSLINSGGSSENVETVVDLRNGNQGSPVSSIPVILQLGIGPNQRSLPVVDPDDSVSCRIATSIESGIPSIAAVGANAVSVSTNCVLNWDTTGALDGDKYAVQVVIEEDFSAGRVALDFIVEIAAGANNNVTPTCTLNGIATNFVEVGEFFTISTTGTDADGDDLTVDVSPLPPWLACDGSSTNPIPQPLTTTCSGTPSITDQGSVAAVTIEYVDPDGIRSPFCQFTTNVNTPPDPDPELVFYPDVFASGWAEAVVIRNDATSNRTYAYVAAQGAGLLVYNVTDPATIGLPVAFFPPADTCPPTAEGGDSFFADDVALAGAANELLVIAAGPCGLVIASLSVDPANPQFLAQMDFLSPDGAFLGWAKDLSVSADSSRVYVAEYFDGLRIIDISTASAPALVSTWGPADDASFGHAIAVTRDESAGAFNSSHVYVATTEGLRIVDVSLEFAPSAAGSFDTATSDPDAIPQDVVVNGSSVYLPVWMAGLRTLELNAGGPPVQTQMISEQMGEPFFKLEATASRLLATQGVAGLRVFNINSVGTLVPDADLDPIDSAKGLVHDCHRPDGRCWAWNVTLVGDRAYVTLGDFSDSTRSAVGGRLQPIDLPLAASSAIPGSAAGGGASGGGGGGGASVMAASSQSVTRSNTAAPTSDPRTRVAEFIPFRIPVPTDVEVGTLMAASATSKADVAGDNQPEVKTRSEVSAVASGGGGLRVYVGDPQHPKAIDGRTLPRNAEPILVASLDHRRALPSAETLLDRRVAFGAETTRGSSQVSPESRRAVLTSTALSGSQTIARIDGNAPADLALLNVSVETGDAGATRDVSGLALVAALGLVVPLLILWRRGGARRSRQGQRTDT